MWKGLCSCGTLLQIAKGMAWMHQKRFLRGKSFCAGSPFHFMHCEAGWIGVSRFWKILFSTDGSAGGFGLFQPYYF